MVLHSLAGVGFVQDGVGGLDVHGGAVACGALVEEDGGGGGGNASGERVAGWGGGGGGVWWAGAGEDWDGGEGSVSI